MTVARVCPKVTLTVAWRALLLVVAGASVGVIVNLLHPKGVKVVRYVPATMCSASQEQAARISVLSPSDASHLCGNPNALVADVRNAEAFAKGHIAGAVHIPCTGSVADVDRVRSGLVGKKHLVVYGETEDQANQVASDLMRRIDQPEISIAVISGGWTAWFDAGLACSSGPCDDCEGDASRVNE
jgi:rhodanese-related sulfurtransferase